VLPLAREAEPHPTGHQHFELAAGRKEVGHEWGRRDHLLEVVQHEQQVLVAKECTESLDQWLVAGLPYAKNVSDRGCDQVGVSDRRQTHEEHAVRADIVHVGGHAQGKTGLAHAAGTGQGEQANLVLVQQVDEHCHLTLAAHERGRRRGEVRGSGGRGCAGHRHASRREGNCDTARDSGRCPASCPRV
jgi:hypothetical protein